MAKVLVCDDEIVLRALIREVLADHYEIFEAADGNEALAKARDVRPDLILLDMMMPGRTGLDVLNELRADDELSGTRVLMLTARTQADDRAAAATADAYLSKPFSPARLADLVGQMLAEAA